MKLPKKKEAFICYKESLFFVSDDNSYSTIILWVYAFPSILTV